MLQIEQLPCIPLRVSRKITLNRIGGRDGEMQVDMTFLRPACDRTNGRSRFDGERFNRSAAE